MALAITGVGGNSGIVQRVGAGVALDSDVATFFAAMNAANEPYWPSEVAMVNALVTSLKSANLWDKFTLLWLPVGQNLSGVMRALKHPQGVGTAMTNVGFTQERWNRLVGLDSRETNHSINTMTTEGNYSPNTDTHMMVSVAEGAALSGPNRDMGSSGDRFQLIINFNNTGAYYRSYLSGSAADVVPPALLGNAQQGVWIGSKSSTHGSVSKDGQLLAHVIRPPTLQASDTTLPISIFRAHTRVANKCFDAASIGKSFTPAEHEAVNTIFQTARSARALLTP
jgi:hypothetical protein